MSSSALAVLRVFTSSRIAGEMDVLKAVFLAKDHGPIPVVGGEQLDKFVLKYRRTCTDSTERAYDEFVLDLHPRPYYVVNSRHEHRRTPRFNKLSLVEQCLWNRHSIPADMKHIFKRTYCCYCHRFIRLYHDSGEEYTLAFFVVQFHSPKDDMSSQYCGKIMHVSKTRAMML